MRKIYGEGQRILGVGAKEYNIEDGQWVCGLAGAYYDSSLPKEAQYFDELAGTDGICYPKTDDMLLYEARERAKDKKAANIMNDKINFIKNGNIKQQYKDYEDAVDACTTVGQVEALESGAKK